MSLAIRQTLDPIEFYGDPLRYKLPPWVSTIRPHQAKAVAEIMAHFDAGVDAVFLDAPTGSGKTLIAEMVRQNLDAKAAYVCSDKALQRQFMRDFPYAKLMQGRNNYITEHNPTKTADDCTKAGPEDACDFCDTCPYEVARSVALSSSLACLNTSYFLAATNYAKMFTGRELVVLDEADTLENALLLFVEYKVPTWVAHRTGMGFPLKACRKPTLVRWMQDACAKVERDIAKLAGSVDQKLVRSMQSFVAQTRYIVGQLQRDAQAGNDTDDTGKWIRVYEDDKPSLHLKPVLVANHGAKHLWAHGKKFLLMSGTLISSDEMVDTLGMPLDYATVTVPMTFPVEHRPIVLAPVADMARNAGPDEYRKMAYAIQQVANLHDDRILVHTVSRERAEKLMYEIEKLGGVGRRHMIGYRSAKERDAALERYLKKPGSILFAQSMDRGIDLPGDACRVQVIAKVPFGSLGDRRTAARIHLPGGQEWYTVNTIRTIVQMTGRGVRSADDWATTYIFDAQFGRNLWRPNVRRLFPAYWQEAVDKGRDIRQFLIPRDR